MSASHDVLFVVIDSARKDRMSAYGHDRSTTPAFEHLADGATLYTNAFTPAPWTLPSHCSLFTGQFPTEHGITNGFTDRNLELPADLDTLTETLRARGYATAGFSNNPWVGKLSDLNRGFDRFLEWDLERSRSDVAPPRLRERLYSRFHSLLGRAAGQPHAILKRRFFTTQLIDGATRWLGETADRPSFTFLNLMEAHSPYYPPKSAFRALDLSPPNAIEARTVNARLLAYVLGKTDLDAAHRDRVLEFYDASLRYQDGKLAELLSTLRGKGLYDDTMIVICADHGKTLGKYDRDATPPHYLRDVNVNVPLLVKWPGQRTARTVHAPVELADLPDAMAAGDTGTALPTREGGALVEDSIPHTARGATDVVRWRALATDTRTYVRNEAGSEYLFDRTTGDRIRQPAVAQLRPHRSQLDARVEALAEDAAVAEGTTAENTIENGVEGQLEDLGYLG